MLREIEKVPTKKHTACSMLHSKCEARSLPLSIIFDIDITM